MCNGLQTNLCQMVIERENNKSQNNNTTIVTSDKSEIDDDNNPLINTERYVLMRESTIDTAVVLESDDDNKYSINTEEPAAKHRPPNSYLVDVINKIETGYRKPLINVTSSTTIRRRSDEALAYLICLCGFRDITSVKKIRYDE